MSLNGFSAILKGKPILKSNQVYKYANSGLVSAQMTGKLTNNGLKDFEEDKVTLPNIEDFYYKD